jgi:hypothetical protein
LRIFEPWTEEVAGGQRRLHNEELHNLHTSPNIRMVKSSRITWVGHVSCMGDMRSTYKILVRKPEDKRPCRRPIHRWEDNIKMDVRE